MSTSDVEMTTIKCVLCGLQLQIKRREGFSISEEIVDRKWKVIGQEGHRILCFCPFCKAKQGEENETY